MTDQKLICPECQSGNLESTCIGSLGGQDADMHTCQDCGYKWWADQDRADDYFQVGHFYQKDKTPEPGGCIYVMAEMMPACHGPVLVCEDENGICGIPTQSTTEGFHEVDAETWFHNMDKVRKWREQMTKDSESVIKTPGLILH